MEITQPKTPTEILRLALDKEKKAHDFYMESAMHCKVQVVRDLLEGLMHEESRHIKLIQGMLARLQNG